MQMIRDKEWCYIMIKESIHQRYNNPKWVCNKQESFKTPEAKTTLAYSLTASSKVKFISTYYPAFPLLGIYPREITLLNYYFCPHKKLQTTKCP